jgi:hypothetical protein
VPGPRPGIHEFGGTAWNNLPVNGRAKPGHERF